MSVFVSHDSACWYWRHANDFMHALENRCGDIWSGDLSELSITPELIKDEKLFGGHRVHLLAPDAFHRPLKTRYCYHVCSKALPALSFCRLMGEIFVSSPELLIAQMAPLLSPFQLADLCMEFMGTYALRSDTPRGFATRQTALVTREQIMSLLQMLLGKRSYSQLAAVLEHVASGSRSPMETREYLLLFLPKKYGGYGLPKAKINARIELSRSQQLETGRRYVECDLFWPEYRIAVEYDGDYDHASHEARTRDATKRNVLQACGIQQFTVTARQIFDANAFDAVARALANALHLQLRHFPDDWKVRRGRLRNDLFKSLRIND